MAVGATYPAIIKNANGDETQGIDITFTDSGNQPSGDTVPFVPDTGDDVVVLETSTGDPLIEGGDDTGGVVLLSADGDSSLVVKNDGTTVTGDFGATGDITLGDTTAGDTVVGTLHAAGATQLDTTLVVTGVATAAAAAAATNLPRLSQLTSALTITSGTLPDTGTWSSGTAKQNPVTRQITVNVAFVTNGTANAATCAIAISPDNVTFTTIGTLTASVAVNTVGAVQLVAPVNLPAGWYIKLTFAQGTVAASIYY